MATNLKETLERLDNDKREKAIKLLIEYEKFKQKCEGELQARKVAETNVTQFGKSAKNFDDQIQSNKQLITQLNEVNVELQNKIDTKVEDEDEEEKLERIDAINMNISANKNKITQCETANREIEPKKQEFLQKQATEQSVLNNLKSNQKLQQYDELKRKTNNELTSLGLNINLDNYDTAYIHQKLSVVAQPEPPIGGFERKGSESKWDAKKGLFGFKEPLEKELKSINLAINPAKQDKDKWEAKDKQGNIFEIQPDSVSTTSDDPALFPKLVETLIATQKAKALAEGKPFDIEKFNAKATGPNAKEIDALFQKRKAELIAQNKSTDSLSVVSTNPIPPESGKKRTREEPNLTVQNEGRNRFQY